LQLAHKIELKPTNKQKTYFNKASGIARFTWNWALANWNEYYEFNLCLPKDDRDLISGFMLKLEFNKIKKEEYPWVFEVTKYACQQPFLQLDRAFKSYFKGISQRPRYKKRERSRKSFYIGGDQIKVNHKVIKIPCLGLVKMKEELRFKGKIRSATVSKTADKWFVSLQVDTEVKKLKPYGNSIGVDLGINTMVQLSNGLAIKAPNPLKINLKNLKRKQKRLSKKAYNTKNYKKQKLKVAKTHYKIASIRKDTLHKTTSYLINNFKNIAIEDLNVKGMLKNHRLARSISDIGFYEIRRQLEYKALKNDNVIYLADRFYPSSKKCSSCHNVKEDLSLKERTYKCKCGLNLDRDLNASINLNYLMTNKIRKAVLKLMPLEVMALNLYNYEGLTSADELGSKHQALYG
jgi:putative transposase